jgi:hypothetical protein
MTYPTPTINQLIHNKELRNGDEGRANAQEL